MVPAHPFADRTIPPSGMDPAQLPPPIRISGIGGSAHGTAEPVVIDSRRFTPQVAERPPWIGEQIRPGSILPAHSRNKTLFEGAPNTLSSGTMTDRPRIAPGTVAFFPGIASTPGSSSSPGRSLMGVEDLVQGTADGSTPDHASPIPRWSKRAVFRALNATNNRPS